MQIQLEQALEYVAGCVAQHGEAYLPLFERLELEVENARMKESALERAKRISKRAA